MPAVLEYVSNVFGWCYVICWGASLYPPLRLNYSTKSVEAISIDFVWLNFCGSALYLASVVLLFYNGKLREKYAQRNAAEFHHDKPALPLVRFNDVIYGLHSFILIMALLYQFYFLGYRRNHRQHMSRTVKLLLLLIFCSFIALLLHAYTEANTKLELLDLATIFGSVKVALSAIKYIPQAWYNYTRKSMKGFAISSCVIDICGAVCCLVQLFTDSYLEDDINFGFKHPTKLLLSLVTIVFCMLFLLQARLYSEHRRVHEKLV